jgi:hypothetical protein
MRRTLGAFAGLLLLAGCGFFNKTLGLKSTTPEYSTPSTTSIYGDWVLASAPDSTAFVGAKEVRLALQPGTFTITADYPAQAAVVVSGSAQLADDGTLTLVPSAGTSARQGALAMIAGQPLSLLVSAAGNTLVFKPPTDRALEPSSVWHKYAKAKQAGTVKD